MAMMKNVDADVFVHRVEQINRTLRMVRKECHFGGWNSSVTDDLLHLLEFDAIVVLEHEELGAIAWLGM